MDDLPTTVRAALCGGLLDRAPHAAVFYDLDRVDARVDLLRASFPDDTTHAVAVKACPLSSLLKHTTSRGFGAEVASSGELQQALRVGVPSNRVVFDSPAKTHEEIRTALDLGVLLNADNLQELARIGTILEEQARPEVRVGVRLNPEAGAGSIASTSTAMSGSKFGVTLSEHHVPLLEAFERYSWLRGIHVHVGSQGCDPALMVESVRRALDFVQEVDARCGGRRIEWFDIGGGLPVSYAHSERRPDFAEYARMLREACPRLFSGELALVTEFGRAIWANSAYAVSRVEYTKTSGGRKIAVTHLGADMFPRTAYVPDTWRHEISVLGPSGEPKEGARLVQDIAGPLCFSGDLLAIDRELPSIEPGDFVVVHDVGAYTVGMWSHYNSRRCPPVFGVRATEEKLQLLRHSDSLEDTCSFWD